MNKTVEMLVQILLTYGPNAYSAAVALFHKSDPTTEDFLALGQEVKQESYDQFIAEARARKGAVAP